MAQIILMAVVTCLGCTARYVVVPASIQAGQDCVRQCMLVENTCKETQREPDCTGRKAACFQTCPGNVVFQGDNSAGTGCETQAPVPGPCTVIPGS
jgi:hypothetical protein